MSMKKINAWMSLITTGLILMHEGYQLYAYAAFYYNPALSAVTGFALLFVMLIHAILSGISCFVVHDSKRIAYKLSNRRTVLQRVSAVASILLLPLHVCAFPLLMSAPSDLIRYLTAGSQVLFYASINTHAAVSVGNAFITLGWLTDRKKREILGRLAWIVCVVLIFAVSILITVTQLKLTMR